MEKKNSLLLQIKSKYILQDILANAFGDIKSLLKLIKYNKKLQKIFNINIKDLYNYKLKTVKKKKYYGGDENNVWNDYYNKGIYCIILLNYIEFIFLPFLIYIIMFYIHGTFNDNNLREGYDKKKKNFVDFMDNYILLPYFFFMMISCSLNIILPRCRKIDPNGLIKAIYFSLDILLDFTHYIYYIIKFRYTRKLMKKELLKKLDKGKTSKLTWFYSFDLALIVFTPFHILCNFVILYLFWITCKITCYIKINCLVELNGINIEEIELESKFGNLNEKSKSEYLFKKENIEKYEYKLNENQIGLIEKINKIRVQNNIPKLQYNIYEKIPNFIINPKFKLLLNKNENIYKISNNLYIFKYNKNELQNLLNDKEIINIIKFGFLDIINIIEKNNTEFISIYNSRPENNYAKNLNNNIDIYNIDIPHINIINTEDKFVGLEVSVINERDISEKTTNNEKK